MFAQRAGFTLEEVGGLLSRLPADRVPTGEDWSQLTSAWVERIDRRMEELKRLRQDLSQCIGCGCLSMETCALANPGDRAARLGAGPAAWRDRSGSGGAQEQRQQ